MEISYRREIKHNYLVITPDPAWDAGYEAGMLACNEVQGLLRMHIRYQDGNAVYYYDITSRQPLNRLLETRFITRDEICRILIQIHVALMRMEEYLLSDSGILLEPEYIYMEPELFQLGLCLVPGRKGDFPEQLSSFLQYILKCVNHKDRECVVLAYGVYQESLKENYGMDDILKFITPDTRNGETNAGDVSEARIPSDREEETAGDKTNKRALPVQEQAPERAGGESAVTEETESARLPVVEQAMVWLAAAVLLPGAIWLFKGWQAVLELRGILFLLDAGLLAVMAAADGLYVWLKLTGRIGQSKAPREAGRGFSKEAAAKQGFPTEPEDSPWRILYEDEDDEASQQEMGSTDRLPGGIADAAPCTEELCQTTLLSERLPDSDARRLTALNTGEEDILIPYYPFVIGKHKDLADYALLKDTVSRFHLRIDKAQEGFTVTDLNSTNGTRVKGRILDANETAPLEIGDEIYIADVGYTFC